MRFKGPQKVWLDNGYHHGSSSSSSGAITAHEEIRPAAIASKQQQWEPECSSSLCLRPSSNQGRNHHADQQHQHQQQIPKSWPANDPEPQDDGDDTFWDRDRQTRQNGWDGADKQPAHHQQKQRDQLPRQQQQQPPPPPPQQLQPPPPTPPPPPIRVPSKNQDRSEQALSLTHEVTPLSLTQEVTPLQLHKGTPEMQTEEDADCSLQQEGPGLVYQGSTRSSEGEQEAQVARGEAPQQQQQQQQTLFTEQEVSQARWQEQPQQQKQNGALPPQQHQQVCRRQGSLDLMPERLGGGRMHSADFVPQPPHQQSSSSSQEASASDGLPPLRRAVSNSSSSRVGLGEPESSSSGTSSSLREGLSDHNQAASASGPIPRSLSASAAALGRGAGYPRGVTSRAASATSKKGPLLSLKAASCSVLQQRPDALPLPLAAANKAAAKALSGNLKPMDPSIGPGVPAESAAAALVAAQSAMKGLPLAQQQPAEPQAMGDHEVQKAKSAVDLGRRPSRSRIGAASSSKSFSGVRPGLKKSRSQIKATATAAAAAGAAPALTNAEAPTTTASASAAAALHSRTGRSGSDGVLGAGREVPATEPAGEVGRNSSSSSHSTVSRALSSSVGGVVVVEREGSGQLVEIVQELLQEKAKLQQAVVTVSQRSMHICIVCKERNGSCAVIYLICSLQVIMWRVLHGLTAVQ